MKRIRQFITGAVLLLSFGFALSPAVVHATAVSDACGAISGGTDCTNDTSGGVDLGKVVKAVINIFSVVTGIVAVIMLITSGFKYVTSAGDSNKVTSAKNTIIYALIGVVIVALAQVIVKFTVNQAVRTPTTTTQQKATP